MLIIKEGDLLKAKENLICHQVNVNGIMGGGLAYQIANICPDVLETYKEFCNFYNNDWTWLQGVYLITRIKKNKYIANCFTQKPNFETDYEALEDCFEDLLTLCKNNNKTIAIPYKYGCGIAKGNWIMVKKILEKLSVKYEIDISVYKL